MSNTITRTLAGAAIAGTMAGAAFAGTAAAHAYTSDEFIHQVTAHGWYEYTPGWVLNLGYRTCGLLNAGYSYAAVVNDVYYLTDANTSWSASSTFVTLADEYLC